MKIFDNIEKLSGYLADFFGLLFFTAILIHTFTGNDYSFWFGVMTGLICASFYVLKRFYELNPARYIRK